MAEMKRTVCRYKVEVRVAWLAVNRKSQDIV